MLQDIEFLNVRSLWQQDGSTVVDKLSLRGDQLAENQTVIVTRGRIECFGSPQDCLSAKSTGHATIDLRGGSLSLGLISYGAPIGLIEISQEQVTGDENRPLPLEGNPPSILHDEGGALAGVDALQFNGRDTL